VLWLPQSGGSRLEWEGFMAGSHVASWPKRISAITLFVEDLAAAKRFYREVLGLPVRQAR
jgi:catechol-2,3-dioxygenase